ncbi:DUF927 domain-containing protein [Halotalea alkalilenta]|uniref:DUF927 domain-containing protein n=1 Tax=Halotalea alkalilenta TaxID=376489 RepID=UPI0009DEEDF9|nr:DUF927 domain-containing protein [Halotalea alkalilenta]
MSRRSHEAVPDQAERFPTSGETAPRRKEDQLTLIAEGVREDQAPVERLMPPRPCFAVYTEPTTVEGKHYVAGTWYHGLKQSPGDDRGIPVDHWICAPLFVVAETVDSEDGSVGRLLRFDYRGRTVEWVMAMESLAGKGEELLRALMRQGLVVEYYQRKLIPAYIASHHRLDQVLATTTKPGWHAASGAFVLPGRIIGEAEVRYQESGRGVRLFTQAGTLAAWQAEVARPCLGNPVLILSLCCALAGPLLYKVGVHGGGVHLVGDSSSGKSLAQLVAASVWGDPGVFAASWDISKGGVEIEATSRNDTILILDEIKRADPKRVQEMAYAIANGTGKGTMTREREGRPKLYWRLLALSSGERSLSEHAAISGNPAHAGAELRMVDVNAGSRRHRAFDDLHGLSGEEFHRTLTVATHGSYGHAGPVFVERLLEHDDLDRLCARFAEIRNGFDVRNAQAGRVADRFALIALAGELAIDQALLPWQEGDALNACRQLFAEWLARVGDGNAEDRQILASIADFIDRHGDSRFSCIDSFVVVNQRAGYWELQDDQRLYLFNRAGLAEAAPGFGLDRIVKALVAAEALAKRDAGKWQKNYRLKNGGQTRLYVIDPTRLEVFAGQEREVDRDAEHGRKSLAC